MQQHITPNNKLASLGTVGLLFLAGITGMVFLLPLSPAHAAGPTVTLSTLSSGVLTAVTSTTVGTTVTIEGFGFAPATPITIISTVGTLTVQWLTQQSCATTNGGVGTINSLVTGTTSPPGTTGCLVTTAVGNFATEVAVPALPGGTQAISVSDGVSTATATFTVTPKITFKVATGSLNFGFPEETLFGASTFTATGFGASESISIATTAFTAASLGTPTIATSTLGSGSTTASSLVVADTTGGAKTITATGATSGLTATATYTVNPWAAFYNSIAGFQTTFSFIGTAPTSLLIEAHGLPAATIAAGSITVGVVTTNHAAITPGASGAVYDVVVSPTANVPFGLAPVVVGGITFNYASGNILSTMLGVANTNYWGGALISSITGTSSSTGVVTADKPSYMPGSVTPSTTSPAPTQGQISYFGYGFCAASGCTGGAGGAVTIPTPTGAFFCTTAADTTCTMTSVSAFIAGNGGTTGGVPDANGALFGTTFLGDTPWSSASTPTTAASYTQTITQATHAPANILNPTFGITPWIGTIAPTSVDYLSTQTVAVHGFGATDTVTETIGGASLVTGAAGFGTCPAVNGFCTTTAGQVPDLAGGKQNVAMTGSITGTVVTGTGAVTYSPFVGNTGAGGLQALSINTGAAGQVTTLRTGAGYGVHGLLANDAYQVVWNPIGGSVTIGTFTATATGGIPIPGVQVTIPSDSSGIHIIDIQNTGSYAIFGSLFGSQTTPSEGPFPNSAYTTGFGDLLFKNVALLQAAPSVAVIGAPESLSGTGLAAGASYVVTLSSMSGTVFPNSSPALATFTATGTGGVPSGTTITLSDTPTTLETGTVEYLTVQTNAHYGVSPYSSDAYAQFVLAASASLNMTSAPAGHPVVISAHALNTGGVYNIVFNYVQSPFSSTSYTGTTVGVIAPNSVGAGSATFNVPAGVTTGSYPIDLVVSSPGTGGAPVNTAILDIPPTLTVGGTSGSCTNEGTACMGISGTPTVTKQGGNTIISASYTNNSNAPQTAFVYAVVHNALGQTVLYTTATITPGAGSSQVGQLVLFGLAPGTYSASVFVVSGSGTALSTPTTVSVTI